MKNLLCLFGLLTLSVVAARAQGSESPVYGMSQQQYNAMADAENKRLSRNNAAAQPLPPIPAHRRGTWRDYPGIWNTAEKKQWRRDREVHRAAKEREKADRARRQAARQN